MLILFLRGRKGPGTVCSMRSVTTTAAAVAFTLCWTGQAALARDLLGNGGFEEGTRAWTAVLGPYGRPGAGWDQGRGIAEVVEGHAFEGMPCLRLNAGDLAHEIDAYSARYAVRPSCGFRGGRGEERPWHASSRHGSG